MTATWPRFWHHISSILKVIETMKKELSRGDRLKLRTRHTFALEMSPVGGIISASNLEVEAGTEVIVAENCEPQVFNIPIHFVEESLNKRGGGQPFFTNRHLLARAATCQHEAGN
jgi:hypothetical protein